MKEAKSQLYPSLRDKVALITGAGNGLGKGAALELAKAGVKIGLLDIDDDDAKEVQTQILEEGGDAVVLIADVTSAEQMDSAAKKLADAYGRIDIVFANAGINGKWAGIDNFEPGEWERVIDINLNGTYHTIRCVMPIMKKANKGGSIIITSSINGTRTFSNSGASAYSASKAGQAALTQMLALELAKHKIRVNAVCPGSIESQIHERTIHANELIKEPVIYPEGDIPLTDGEPGTQEDVGNLICFLASNASKHISGAVIHIDGGQSLLLA